MCAKIMLLKQIMDFLGIKVALPIIVRVDNVGAICLAQNGVLRPRMKHVNIKYLFLSKIILQLK
jgi:hypothetical protein